MNDFTKEQLEIISECVIADFNQTNWPRCMYEPIISKIQSLIDNYCDHEQCGDGAGLEQVCSKCHKSSNEGWK